MISVVTAMTSDNRSYLSWSEDQGRILSIGPLTHGTVVVAGAVIAQQFEDKQYVRRTYAPLSIRHNFFVWRRTHGLQHAS